MTTPHEPDDDLDRLLDPDGGELGALYRRLPRMEPARRLDRNVLGEAARAMHGRPPRKQRWIVGVGSAAGLVLAAGVAWHVGQDALHQPAPTATYSTPAYVPVQPIEPSARHRHDAPAVQTADAPATQSAPADNAGAAQEVTPQRAAKPPVQKAAKESRLSVPPVSVPQPLAMPAPPPAQIAPAAVAADKARSEDVRSSAAASAGAMHRADEGEPESAAQEVMRAKRERSSGSVTPSTSIELRRDMQLAPQDWLAHIEQLLQQGRRQQALESLQLFRRMHPDWKISKELRALGN